MVLHVPSSRQPASSVFPGDETLGYDLGQSWRLDAGARNSHDRHRRFLNGFVTTHDIADEVFSQS